MSKINDVTIFEVGPRDGLQNEKHILSFSNKIWLIEALASVGLKNIETGAFVRGDKVPQMADTDELQDKLFSIHAAAPEQLKANYWYLVPNQKGLERALAKKVNHIALFSAATDSFNKKNIGMSIDESFDEMKVMIEKARLSGIKVRGYISTVWGCPFEGRVPAQKAISVIERMLALGVDQVSVGDTIGVATPAGVKAIVQPILKNLGSDSAKLAVHFHDTRGTALANTAAAYDLGVKTFDSSIGGLGGCPFAPGAAGNLATEDLVYFLKEMGISTGIHYKNLCETSIELSKRMDNRPIRAKSLQAYVANCQKNSPWDT